MTKAHLTPPPLLSLHPPTHPTKTTDFFLLLLFVYFDGCYDPQMAKTWKLQAGQRMLHLIGQNLPTTFGESLIWNSVPNDVLLQAA